MGVNLRRGTTKALRSLRLYEFVRIGRKPHANAGEGAEFGTCPISWNFVGDVVLPPHNGGVSRHKWIAPTGKASGIPERYTSGAQ